MRSAEQMGLFGNHGADASPPAPKLMPDGDDRQRGTYKPAARVPKEPPRIPLVMTTLAEGTPVIYRNDDGSSELTVTASAPWQLGHGQWVVKLEGKTGGHDLARVSLVTAKGGLA